MPGLVPGISLRLARPTQSKRDGRDKPGHDEHKDSLMAEELLKNPLSLFDIRGKTAIVTGASGAFGALAAKVLAGAGANVVLAAGNAAELKKVAGECETLGAKVASVAKRPGSEANCEA